MVLGACILGDGVASAAWIVCAVAFSLFCFLLQAVWCFPLFFFPSFFFPMISLVGFPFVFTRTVCRRLLFKPYASLSRKLLEVDFLSSHFEIGEKKVFFFFRRLFRRLERMFRGCYRAPRDVCGCFVLACFLFCLVFNACSLLGVCFL